LHLTKLVRDRLLGLGLALYPLRGTHRKSGGYDVPPTPLGGAAPVLEPEKREINFVHYFLHPACVMDHPSCATGPAIQRLAMRGCS